MLPRPSLSPSKHLGSPRVAGTEALTDRGKGTGDCGLRRCTGEGVSSRAPLCAPLNVYPHLGGFSLPLFSFTSWCLTRDLPTFHAREAHKTQVVSVWREDPGLAPGSRGKTGGRVRGAGLGKDRSPGCFSCTCQSCCVLLRGQPATKGQEEKVEWLGEEGAWVPH